jgi:hypothetical protein
MSVPFDCDGLVGDLNGDDQEQIDEDAAAGSCGAARNAHGTSAAQIGHLFSMPHVDSLSICEPETKWNEWDRSEHPH